MAHRPARHSYWDALCWLRRAGSYLPGGQGARSPSGSEPCSLCEAPPRAASQRVREAQGGPPPAGRAPGRQGGPRMAARQLTFRQESDMRWAFRIVAGQPGARALDRDEARAWFRCLGFAAPASELDALLDGPAPGLRPRPGAPAAPAAPPGGRGWGLAELRELHAQALQAYGEGKCDLEGLADALDEACDAAGRPSLGALREVALQRAPAGARLDPELCEDHDQRRR
ncbi:unnamed protein product [Prorocentrum cordatum]|uniref:Uncharacterized protein n=1 Tax=Prorocentrum cordatum TaxID=2364126 RepID=A0ABN9T4Q4_9DINO|nr:unnamed protein product [Polarella glacialis]